MIKAIDAEMFFEGDRPRKIPSDSGKPDFKQLVSCLKKFDHSTYQYQSLKTVLERENRRLGAGKAAIKSLESIDNNTVFIVSGQQAGLFGGPLYTFYKAMHSVRLASRLSEQSGSSVVPLFWVASDDHDFDEVKQLGVKTHDGAPLVVEYKPRMYREGVPVGEIVLDEGIYSAIDSLAGHLPKGDFAEKYLGIIRGAWKPGRLWSEAFAIQMSRIFERYGLVIFDPGWAGIKTFFRQIFTAELSDPTASAEMVNREADTFEESRKRKKAIRKPEGSTNLFLTVNGIRYPVLLEKKGFRAGKTAFSKNELLDLAGTAPERFSPAAALRPICQDAVLPAAALICGPGERIYLEQIKPLYAHFGVNRSIPWPRASFTVIDSRILRNARKENIPVHRLFHDVERTRTNLALESFPEEVEREFDSLANAVETGFSGLAKSISSIDPTLVNSAKKDAGRVFNIIGGIRKRALRAHKGSLAVSEKRLMSALYSLLPDGGPQERWFGMDSILPLLSGEGFEEFLALTSPDEERHRTIMPAG